MKEKGKGQSWAWAEISDESQRIFRAKLCRNSKVTVAVTRPPFRVRWASSPSALSPTNPLLSLNPPPFFSLNQTKWPAAVDSAYSFFSTQPKRPFHGTDALRAVLLFPFRTPRLASFALRLSIIAPHPRLSHPSDIAARSVHRSAPTASSSEPSSSRCVVPSSSFALLRSGPAKPKGRPVDQRADPRLSLSLLPGVPVRRFWNGRLVKRKVELDADRTGTLAFEQCSRYLRPHRTRVRPLSFPLNGTLV